MVDEIEPEEIDLAELEPVTEELVDES